jgi:hypothetical protein
MAMPYESDARTFVDALESRGPAFDVLDTAVPRPLGVAVRDIRRRRGRIADDEETGYRDLSLVERDGVLLWVFSSDLGAKGTQRRYRRRGQRALQRAEPAAQVLKEVSVPVLEPNRYLEALADTDRKLNGDCDAGLGVVKMVEEKGTTSFLATREGLKPTYSGKTLLIVHGTFSSSANSLNEYAATPDGRQFLRDALAQYQGQVLVFDHPTLSVSPFINGIDLARALAGTTGSLDIIAHSRGGVVVGWWLEVLGDSLSGAQVRAICAGSPLRGTSLAAPSRIHPLLSALSNIGSFVSSTLGVAAAANPFSLASFALLKFIVRREKNNWGIPPIDLQERPGVDAAVAVIPGLQGQAAIDNNYELSRLQASAARANVQYFALTADFEPERIGWKLWKVISEFGMRTTEAVADTIFPAANDLVVDTAHMTSLADQRPITQLHAFNSASGVHHCSYFRQPETFAHMRTWLGMA